MSQMMNLGVSPSEITPGGTVTVTWTNPPASDPRDHTRVTIMPTTTNADYTAAPVDLPSMSSLEIQVPFSATPGVVSFAAVESAGNPVPGVEQNPFIISIAATTTTDSNTATETSATSPTSTPTSATSPALPVAISSTSSGPDSSSALSSSAKMSHNAPTNVNKPPDGTGSTRIGCSSSTSLTTMASAESAAQITSTTPATYVTPSAGSTSMPAPQQNLAKGRSLPSGKIAGIAIGAFIAILILLLLFLFCRKRIRAWKKRSDAPIVRITRTQTSSVDPISTAFTPFGEKVAGVINPEEKAMLAGGSRATTPSDSSESGDHTERYPHSRANLNPEEKRIIEQRRWATTPTASSESGSVPEYPVDVVIPPREGEEQTDQDIAAYGGFTSQQMEELHEQRKKMRDLIEVLKERRASVSSMAKSRIDDLEEGSLSPVRIG